MASVRPRQVARYVFDSFAYLEHALDQPGADAVEALLDAAARGEAEIAMCVVNLGEVQYQIQRRGGPSAAAQVGLSVAALPMEIVDADWALTRVAAGLKAVTPIAYADCFAAALALMRDAQLVTGDPEFHQLEDRISVYWLPRPPALATTARPGRT